MGLRIHRYLGYGIADYKGKNDPRFTPKYAEMEWSYAHATVNDLMAWAEKNAAKVIDACAMDNAWAMYSKYSDKDNVKSLLTLYQPENINVAISRCVTQGGEIGLKKVILFQPFNEVEEWSHYDDMLDYLESGKVARAKVNFLKESAWSGIYPWTGSMYRFRGEPVSTYNDKDYVKGVLNVTHFSQLVGYWDKKLKPHGKPEVIEDLKNNWRCSIPAEIVAVLLYLDIVKDVKSFINDLRPMIYTYWS